MMRVLWILPVLGISLVAAGCCNTRQPPPPPKANQDDRILDQLENAPTLQQEEAKHHKRQARGMVDK